MEEQQELRLEVQRRTKLVEESQKPDEETKPSTATTSFAMIQPNNSKAKTDNYSDGPWGEWRNGENYVPRLTTGMMLNVVNN